MEVLGHKNIKNTPIYTRLDKYNEWHGPTAKTTEKAKKLIESGFDYVCTTPEQLIIFRKRK
jgi:hypothetical protein